MAINKFDGFKFNTLTIAYWSNYINERKTFWKIKWGLLCNLMYIYIYMQRKRQFKAAL